MADTTVYRRVGRLELKTAASMAVELVDDLVASKAAQMELKTVAW